MIFRLRLIKKSHETLDELKIRGKSGLQAMEMNVKVTYDHMATVQQERAKRLGLRLEHHNSGTVQSDTSGWRVFRGIVSCDYFDPHLAHFRTGAMMVAWLDGFEMALTGSVRT